MFGIASDTGFAEKIGFFRFLKKKYRVKNRNMPKLPQFSPEQLQQRLSNLNSVRTGYPAPVASAPPAPEDYASNYSKVPGSNNRKNDEHIDAGNFLPVNIRSKSINLNSYNSIRKGASQAFGNLIRELPTPKPKALAPFVAEFANLVKMADKNMCQLEHINGRKCSVDRDTGDLISNSSGINMLARASNVNNVSRLYKNTRNNNAKKNNNNDPVAVVGGKRGKTRRARFYRS